MEAVLTLVSTHATMAASEALTRAGIAHRVIPKPAFAEGDCGVAVLLEDVPAEAALAHLTALGHRVVSWHAREDRSRAWVRMTLGNGPAASGAVQP
jgi:hypothetical protein